MPTQPIFSSIFLVSFETLFRKKLFLTLKRFICGIFSFLFVPHQFPIDFSPSILYSHTSHVVLMVEGLFPENIIPRKVPCKHWSKTFLEWFACILHPNTFPEKASPFFVATKCNTSKLVWRCCKVFQ